ncbi:MAG: MGMT family protein [bacterium]|nr:MGMT family protein [bacterium]
MEQRDFFRDVYEVVRLIPFGRVTSYGAIARYLGSTRGARLVGYAMNAAHQQEKWVPAHRVLNRNGLLTGKHHFANENEMQLCLEKEGLIIENEQVKDFERHFWDPNLELTL